MKTIVMIIGVLFLISSCECFKVEDDVRRTWSFKFNECGCQNYSFKKVTNLDEYQPCEEFYAPIVEKHKKDCKDKKFAEKYPEKCQLYENWQYCDDLTGFGINSWARNLTPKGRETKACVEDKAKALAEGKSLPACTKP